MLRKEDAVRVEYVPVKDKSAKKILIFKCKVEGCNRETRVPSGPSGLAKSLGFCRGCCSKKFIPLPEGCVATSVHVVKRSNGKNQNLVYYHFSCEMCGRERKITKQQFPLIKGKLCGGCGKRSRLYETLYKLFCTAAESVQLGNSISYEDFVELTKIKKCSYCPNEISWTEYNIQYNGGRYNLDRKNNNLGYHLDNVAVCCKECNLFKKNFFNYEEMLAGAGVLSRYRKGEIAFQKPELILQPLDIEDRTMKYKRLRPYESLYNTFNRQQKNRSLIQNLSYEDFLQFTRIKNCEYCGNPIDWIKFNPVKYRGGYNLDRKNPDKGYEIDNIAVSCWTCNSAKLDILNYEEMILFMRAVIEIRSQSPYSLGASSF